jgi:hypothetical protein
MDHGITWEISGPERPEHLNRPILQVLPEFTGPVLRLVKTPMKVHVP